MADTVEYHDGETLEDASLIVVNQLKYSTQHPDRPWSWSDIEPMMEQFAARYRKIARECGVATARSKLRFRFVTNRPISKNVLDAIDHLTGKSADSPAQEVQFAHVVDQGARAIIRALIGDAVRQGLAEEKDWIWLVRSGLPDIEPIVVLLEEAVVTSQPMDGEAPKGRGGRKSAVDTEEAAAASKLQAERNELVERLRAFASVAEEIASHLETPRGTKPGGKGGRSRRATGDGPQPKSRKRRDG